MSVCLIAFDVLAVVRTFHPCHLIGKLVICRQKGRRADRKLLTASHIEGVEGCLEKLRSLVKIGCEWRLKLTKMLKLGVVGGRAGSGTGVEA